ncbi:SseB family protein [Stenotrophomonas sp. TWI1151]|uniref:SseB family protein n=1 Tax=Stenotrophomonas sp. TWI1151 TaxID=3136798 RepID=UPI00320BAB97
MNDAAPQTPIETLLKTAMDGQLPIGLFMKAFVASEVVLLTGSLVTPDGSGFDPLLFDKQGVLHVSVFTDMSRVGVHSQQAPHTIRMLMLEVLRRVPGGYGVVINPGTSLGFEISPSGVGEILKDFADAPR